MPQGLEHPAVHVVPRRFSFGGSVEVNILCRASPDEAEQAGSEKQFLEDLEALRGCDVTDTIGWDIWEGATTKLCELLVACPAIVRGKRCVEIGAGPDSAQAAAFTQDEFPLFSLILKHLSAGSPFPRRWCCWACCGQGWREVCPSDGLRRGCTCDRQGKHPAEPAQACSDNCALRLRSRRLPNNLWHRRIASQQRRRAL